MQFPVGPIHSLQMLRSYLLATFHIDIGRNVQRGIRVFRDQKLVLLFNSHSALAYEDTPEPDRAFVQYMLAGRVGDQRLTGDNKMVFMGARGYRILYYEASHRSKTNGRQYNNYYVYGFYRITDRRQVDNVIDSEGMPRKVYFVQLSVDRDLTQKRII